MKPLHTPKTHLIYTESVDDDYPEGMVVEIGDEVEFQTDIGWGLQTHTGEVMAIMPRKRMVRLTYLDGHDVNKAGEPRRKSAIVLVADLTFIARSM